MVVPPELPTEFSARPLTLADAHEVAELVRADEVDIVGEAVISEPELIAHWRRPSFDLSTQSVGICAVDGSLVACGEVTDGDRAEVNVRIDRRGRGLGTALMHWTWRLAQAAGSPLVGQTVPAGHVAARELLAANGYTERWTSWVLDRHLADPGRPVELPPGHSVRQLRPGDEPAMFTIIEDAFNEWPGRTPSTFDDWSASMLRRDDAQDWWFQVLADRDGVLVGAAALSVDDGIGWVDQLAVRRDRRGAGLARALLNAAFGEFRDRGYPTARLSTDSRTGALGLYLHVGMTVSQEWISLAKRFDDGR